MILVSGDYCIAERDALSQHCLLVPVDRVTSMAARKA